MQEKLFKYLRENDYPNKYKNNWWVIMENTVVVFNKDNGTSFEPSDSVLNYLESPYSDVFSRTR